MPRHYGNNALSKNHVQSLMLPTDPFGDIRTVERTNIMDVKSTFNVSNVRDHVTATGGGTFTATGSEFLLQTTTQASDAITVQTREHARYQAGYGAECGLGIRIPTAFSGQVARWGLYDGENGFYYQLDTDISVNLIRDGLVTKIQRQNFSVDKLDGSGPSGLILDFTRGNVFKILFAWYGYGAVVFLLAMTDNEGSQCVVPVHQLANPGHTSVETPHLPIRVELLNNGATTSSSMYLSGRQFTVVGKFNPPVRTTPVIYDPGSLSLTQNVLKGVLAIQRKTGYDGTNCLLRGIEFLINTRDAVYHIYTNATVTGGSWVDPQSTDPNETALQVNTSLTSFSGGYLANAGILSNDAYMGNFDTSYIHLCQGEAMVIAVKPYGGTNASLGVVVCRIQEEW